MENVLRRLCMHNMNKCPLNFLLISERNTVHALCHLLTFACLDIVFFSRSRAKRCLSILFFAITIPLIPHVIATTLHIVRENYIMMYWLPHHPMATAFMGTFIAPLHWFSVGKELNINHVPRHITTMAIIPRAPFSQRHAWPPKSLEA